MTAVRVRATGEQPDIGTDTVDIEEPQTGQVRLRMQAAGLCFADVLMSRGMYPGTPKEAFTLGYDVVGTVEAMHESVHDVLPESLMAGLTVRGGLGELVLAPTERCVPLPAGIDPAAAACLPLNYVTAHQLLHRMAKLVSGETVLVHGAAGGVGTAVLDLCRRLDVTVLGVCSGARAEVVRGLGAIPIDRDGDVWAQVHAHCPGADVVLDPVGGEQLALSRDVLAPDGRLVTFGYAYAALYGTAIAKVFVAQQAKVRWWRLRDRGRTYLDYSITDRAQSHPADYRADLTALVELLGRGEIAPQIAGRPSLTEVPGMYGDVAQGRVRGKLVARPD